MERTGDHVVRLEVGSHREVEEAVETRQCYGETAGIRCVPVTALALKSADHSSVGLGLGPGNYFVTVSSRTIGPSTRGRNSESASARLRANMRTQALVNVHQAAHSIRRRRKVPAINLAVLDQEIGSCDETRLVRSQIDHEVSDVFRRANRIQSQRPVWYGRGCASA